MQLDITSIFNLFQIESSDDDSDIYTGGDETDFSLSDSGSDDASESSPQHFRDINISSRETIRHKPASCSNLCTPSRKTSHKARGISMSTQSNFYKIREKNNQGKRAVVLPVEAQKKIHEKENCGINIANVLSEMTNTLKQIASRLDQQESRLVSMEAKLEVSSSSSTTPRSATKPKIPLVIRVCTRTYNIMFST